MTKHLIAITAAALALQGCAAQLTPAQLAAEDYNEGIAKTCNASAADLSNAAAGTATIAMTNDGWCGVRVTEKDGQPFQLGLVKTRPEHGRVLIQRAGNQTRVEYTADNRYVGTDRFTVALRSRAGNAPDSMLQVAVTVAMGESTAPAPAPTPTRPTTPARRTTPAKPASRS